MASPILRLFDSAGDEVVAPIVFGAALPGVPTAEQTFGVRNNDGGVSPVDTGFGVFLVVTSRIAGSADDFVSLGNRFADAAAAQSRVISFTGGATGNATGFRRSPLLLGNIPDGAQIELGVQIVATAASATSDWEVSFALETNPFVPLSDVGFETIGNFVYNGQGGGTTPDPDFTSIQTVTGSYSAGTPDATIDLPTLVTYYLEGILLNFEPAPPTLTFDDLDGAAAALLAGEYYWAGLSLDSAATQVVTKGLKATLPADDADKPTLPIVPVDMVFVVVPFGLAIDTIEQIFEIGFFQEQQTGGLDLTIQPGIGASAGFWSRIQTPVELTLTDDEINTTWLLPGNALEVTTSSAAFPSERRSLPLWLHTTVAGAITEAVSLRRIGQLTIPGLFQAATFVVDAAAGNLQVVHVTIRDGLGAPVLENLEIGYKISDNPDGNGTSANGLTDLTVGALPQSVRFLGDNLVGVFETDLDGVVDVTFDESSGPSGQTFFLVIQAFSRKFVSDAITPKP